MNLITIELNTCMTRSFLTCPIVRSTIATRHIFSGIHKIESGLQEIMMLYSLTTSILIAVNLTYLMFRIQ